MDNYIEGTFFKASDGSSMLHRDDTAMISLTDGKAMKINYGGEWISGIHIGGDIIYSGGKDKLQTGDRIRIKK